jgi:hypothetical protein
MSRMQCINGSPMELNKDTSSLLKARKRVELEKAWLSFMGVDHACLEKFSDFVKHYSHEELAKPFIVRDLKLKRQGFKKYTIHQLMKKYAVGERCIRSIGAELGVYRN